MSLRPARPLTLRAWGARWLRRRRKLVRGIDRDISSWRTHVETWELVDAPLEALTRTAVRDWALGLLDRRARRGVPSAGAGVWEELEHTVTRNTVKRVLTILRTCLRDAVEEGLLEANPAVGIRLPPDTRTSEPWTYLTVEEIAQLLGCDAIPLRTRLIYQVAIYTGLRKGELWGLRWGDVELEGDRPQITVARSYAGPTKGGRVARVPLLVPAQVALRRTRELATDAGPRALVFPNRDGRMRTRSDSAGWRRHHRGGGRVDPGWPARAGIARRVRFHDLRHTCASHLVMGSWGRPWALVEVRDFLRHRQVAVTERYAHLAPGALHAAARATVPVSPTTVREQARQLLDAVAGGHSLDAQDMRARVARVAAEVLGR